VLCVGSKSGTGYVAVRPDPDDFPTDEVPTEDIPTRIPPAEERGVIVDAAVSLTLIVVESIAIGTGVVTFAHAGRR
jgi:hypothetical protein